MNITSLGEGKFPSPKHQHVSDSLRVPARIIQGLPPSPDDNILFELAGPRAKLFFDPAKTRAGIVTCGGLCPGLNNVIRSIFFELQHAYGVKEVLGFRDGYQGLDPARCREPLVLTPEFVDDIHKEGGTVLGTSRGPVDTGIAVDNLIKRGVHILFTIGGDGTQRGGNDLFQEAKKRGHALAVVGVPKTIDNDITYIDRTFGFQTAVEESSKVLHCAHTESKSVQNGISIVKLMGRHAGFIAMGATIASQDVNFCLIPEVPFKLDGPRGFLRLLKERIINRAHAVVVVAEGVGQDLLAESGGRDESGNPKLRDIGPFMCDRVISYFKAEKVPATIRYFDPSYVIRSVPADAEDAIICDVFARSAVHAGMAGKTGMVVGYLHDKFIHIPTDLLAGKQKRVDPNGSGWQAALATTGQPARFE